MTEPSVLQVFVFKAGNYVGSEVFTEDEIVIGSGDGVDLALDDAAVANNHAILSHGNDQATLLDLGAPNGTMINRTRIQHSYVTPRDEIQIGGHTLKIKFMTPKRARPRVASPAAAPPAAAGSASAPRGSAPPSARSAPAAPDPTGGVLGSAGLAGDLSTNQDAPTQVVETNRRATAQLDFPSGGIQSKSPQAHVPTDLVSREPERPQQPGSQTIDDLISGELSRGLNEITASIEISGSDVVSTRAVSGLEAPRGPSHARGPSQPPSSVWREPSGPKTPPPEATPRAQTPADDLWAPEPTTPAPLPGGRNAAGEPSQEPTTKPIGQPPLSAAPVEAEDFEEEHDEEEIEASTRPGFSLVQKLKEAGVRPGPALEAIGFSGGDVRAAVLLRAKGDRIVLGRGRNGASAPHAGHAGLKLAQLTADGQGELCFPSAASGYVESQGQRTSLDSLKVPQNAVSKKGDAFRTELRSGATAVVMLDGETGYFLRFVQPPPVQEQKIAFKLDRFIAKAIGSSLAVHLMAGIVVGLASPGVVYSDIPTEEWAEIEQDDIRDVEIKEPEPEPEPVPEPEPEPVDEPEPEPKKAPPPKKKQRPQRRSRRAPKGYSKKQVKSAGVLGAMGKLNLKAPGKKSMVQAVSNIDAVKAPGGSNFRVGALVGKTPSSKVSVGGGGGGKLLTRGGAALLKGGKGFAKIGKKGGSRVRGRVKRVSSRRLVAKGSISREEVARVINKHLKEVQYCYEKTLLKDPGLSGKLVLQWTIKSNGTVGRVRQKMSTLRNPKVSSCIIASLKRWTFPRPRGGVVIVSYPFIFSSVGF